MKTFIETLQLEFEKNASTAIALQQKSYMRGQFECYGKKPLVWYYKNIAEPILNGF